MHHAPKVSKAEYETLLDGVRVEITPIVSALRAAARQSSWDGFGQDAVTVSVPSGHEYRLSWFSPGSARGDSFYDSVYTVARVSNGKAVEIGHLYERRDGLGTENRQTPFTKVEVGRTSWRHDNATVLSEFLTDDAGALKDLVPLAVSRHDGRQRDAAVAAREAANQRAGAAVAEARNIAARVTRAGVHLE